jgi:hypothetical protein
MKKLLLSLGIILSLASCNNEQKQAEKMEKRMVEKISSACQPTPDQQAKIKVAVEDYINLRLSYRHKYANNQDSLDLENKIAKNNYINTLKTILTPDQVDKVQNAFKQEKTKQSEGTND